MKSEFEYLAFCKDDARQTGIQQTKQHLLYIAVNVEKKERKSKSFRVHQKFCNLSKHLVSVLSRAKYSFKRELKDTKTVELYYQLSPGNVISRAP